MSKNTNRIIQGTPLALAAGLLFSLALAQPAAAAETTSTLDVGATVTANCAVSTTALAFGSVDVTSGQNIDGTGGISVTCTSGTGWAASADAGEGKRRLAGQSEDGQWRQSPELRALHRWRPDLRLG
jgi:spore coat protein U-like protein